MTSRPDVPVIVSSPALPPIVAFLPWQLSVGVSCCVTWMVTVPLSAIPAPNPKSSKLFTWKESVPTKPWFGV